MKTFLTIGRTEDNDIVIGQPQVSSRHAVVNLLSRDPPRFLLRDLNTTNGTFKNKERVTECEVSLEDEILVANVPLDLAPYLPMFDAAGKEDGSVPSLSREKRRLRRKHASGALVGRGNSGRPVAANLGRFAPFLAFLFLTLLFYGVAEPGIVSGARTVDGAGIRFVPLLGALMAAALSVQLGLSILARNRRLAYERQQQELALGLWETRLAEAQQRREIEAEQEPAGWSGLRKFEVAHKVKEGGEVCSFYLIPHDGKALAAFKPGQYLTFSLRIHDHAQPVIRCYSISSSAAKKDYHRVSIKRALPPRDQPTAPMGVSSSFFHDRVEEGDILDVRAPAGHFYLDMNDERPIVLIGGGIGITPVLSMLDSVIDYGQRREVWFFYGVRNRHEHIMAEHLRWADGEFSNIHVQVCYSHPADDDIRGLHYDHAERVSVDLMKRLLPSNNYDFYICGPPPMMESITSNLDGWGVPRDHIHFEAFGPASVKRVSHDGGEAESVEGGCEVEFAKSGKTCRWDPDTGSLLELAEANGISIDYGCRAGNCGTCTVAIREGKVEYLSEPGIESEAGACLACVAYPVANAAKKCLVLDA